MKISQLYEAYAEMDKLPVNARTAEAALAQRRSDTLARFDKRASQAKQAAETTKRELQAELRAEALAASSKGVIPKSGASASGSAPNFTRVRSTREKVERLILEKTRAEKDLERLRSDLRKLEHLIEEELRTKGVWARGKRADSITYGVGGLGLLLSMICGPGLLGSVILVITLGMVGYRLWGVSAFMMLATQKRPALGSHSKSRLGYILNLCGWVGIFSQVLNLMLFRVVGPTGAGLAFEDPSKQGLSFFWILGLLGSIAALIVSRQIQRRFR